MDIDNYLMYIGACVVLCAVPGPDIILLLSRSIANGKRTGLYTALGINLGAYFHLFAAIAGISAVISASAYALTVIKFAGAAYLIYLGVQTLRAKANPLDIDVNYQAQRSKWGYFWQGFWSNVLNPKVAIFYLAFLPQFISPNADTLSQLLMLGVTVNVVGILSNIIIVLFASVLTGRLRRTPRISVFLGKALGAVFIGLGVRLASEKVA